MSRYGRFSEDGSEYIITNPHTPKPWINFLSNTRYCALISATGGGYSFVDDTKYNRITREGSGNQMLEDRPGRYLFLRDEETGEVWTTNWQPIMGDFGKWQSTHGLGYTKISSEHNGIESQIEYFVPVSDTLEVWNVRIKNTSRKTKELSLFSYIEWSLGFFAKDMVDHNYDVFFNNIYFEDNIIFAGKSRTEQPDKQGQAWEKWAFLTGSIKFDGWDCSRSMFLGQGNYLDHPETVFKGQSNNSNAVGEDGVGVLNKRIKLRAGQDFEFNFFLGIGDDKGSIKRLVKEYSKRGVVRKKYEGMRTYWKDFIGNVEVITPDHDFNISANFWNKYQTWMTSIWGESDSFYIGASDIGFRDECQHIYGVLPLDVGIAKKILLELIGNQYKEGYVNHSWNRTTRKGVVTQHSDDTQWLVMAIINYLEETADLEFLKEKVPFYDDGDESVLRHMIRALEFTLYHVSPNGVPLRRTADWNDALAGGFLGKGESMMVANQVCWNIKRLAPFLDRLLERDDLRKFDIDTKSLRRLIEQYQDVYIRMKNVINHHFWDGDWYIRATDDEGNLIGSRANREGKIHLDGQTWAVMSGIADEVRGTQAMDSVWKHLDTPYGPCIFLPSYTHYSSALGIISQFAPGSKENGTIFSHLVAWSVIAECILGRGDKAFEIWKRSSFTTRGEDADVYQVEPYVYSEFIFGPENNNYGRGSYSWMTGSAAWFLRACSDWILGVRPTIDGLFIDPCIPKDWRSFRIKRVFRGTTYHIEVKNPKGVNKGVKSIKVDGKIIKGSLIVPKRAKDIDVEVEMG